MCLRVFEPHSQLPDVVATFRSEHIFACYNWDMIHAPLMENPPPFNSQNWPVVTRVVHQSVCVCVRSCKYACMSFRVKVHDGEPSDHITPSAD